MDKNQFAEQIKAKYPEYRNVDNIVLADKMLAKYPEYRSKVTEKQPNIYDRIVSGARGIGNVLGGNILGENIGTLAGFGYTKAKDIVTGNNQSQYYDLTGATPKQVAGDIFKVGTTVIPTTKIAGAVTNLASRVPVASKIASGIGATAEAGLVGYGQDVGQNLIDQKQNFMEAGVGTSVGLATPAALKAVNILIGKPVGAIVSQFNPDAKTALYKALKPSVKLKEFGKTIDSVAPALTEYKSAGGVIENIDDLLFATKEIKKGFWDKYTELSGRTDTMIDGNLIADKIVSSISARTRLQNPSLAKKIEDVASSYRGFLTPSQAEGFLQEANAELDSFYAKDLSARANALKNPNTAYLVNEAEGLREGLYKAIESATGENVSQLKKMYGNLSQFQKAVEHRAVIEGRQAPFNLAEQLAGPDAIVGGLASVGTGSPIPAILGMGKIGLVKLLKEANATDTLIKKSLKKYSTMNDKQKTALLGKFVEKIGGENDVVQRMLKYPTFKKSYEKFESLPNQQGGFIGVSGGTISGMDDLVKEAKKYKTAEEFVKNFNYKNELVKENDGSLTKVYRATTNDFNPTNIKKSGKGVGLYVTPRKGYAEGFMEDGRKLEELYIKSGVKILTPEKLPQKFRLNSLQDIKKFGSPQERQDKIAEYAKKNGYDVVDFAGNNQNLIVVNTDIVKTKSQLEQIWKEAQKK